MSLYKPKSSPYWHFDFVYQGNRFYGSTGQTSKAAARKIESKKRLEIADGGEKPQLTLHEATTVYWKEVAEMQTSSATTDYQIDNLLRGLGKDILLTDIRQPMIAGYAAKRRARVSDSSVNRELQLARRIWRYAVKRFEAGVSKIDWTALMYREPQERIRELSQDEQTRLFDSLRDDLHDFVTFALITGARKSSIIKLRWSDIDFQSRTLFLQVKGNKTQSLPMTPAIVALLANQPRICVQVFTYICQANRKNRRKGDRYPLTGNGWNKVWRKTLANAGIENFRFHDLRHTAATRIVRRTGNLKMAQRLLGHSTIETTSRYTHVTDDDLRSAMSEIDTNSRNSHEQRG